jgi:glutaredoxin-related protein
LDKGQKNHMGFFKLKFLVKKVVIFCSETFSFKFGFLEDVNILETNWEEIKIKKSQNTFKRAINITL